MALPITDIFGGSGEIGTGATGGRTVTSGSSGTVSTLPPPVSQAVASFTTDVKSGRVPLQVFFTNTSFNPQGYSPIWDFGDNTPQSAQTSPVHTYNYPGNYTARLFLQNLGISPGKLNVVRLQARSQAQAEQVISVLTESTPVLPDFLNIGVSPLLGVYPLVIQCNVLKVRTSTTRYYRWNFGDGTTQNLPPGITASATHGYNNPGTYIVQLLGYDKPPSDPTAVLTLRSNTVLVTVERPKTPTVPQSSLTKLQAAGHIFTLEVTDKIFSPVILDVQVESFGSTAAPNLKKQFTIRVNPITNVPIQLQPAPISVQPVQS